MSQGKPRKAYLERMAKENNKPLFELVDSKEKVWVEKTLTDLYMVNWDRYFIFEGFSLTAFGWIEREDNYKDFVILEFTLKDNPKPSCVYFLGTSSKKYSKKIADILGSEHSDCKRVEDYFEIKNCIKLGEIEWYPQWRKYCFIIGDLVFDNKCLSSLSDILILENDKHRKKKGWVKNDKR